MDRLDLVNQPFLLSTAEMNSFDIARRNLEKLTLLSEKKDWHAVSLEKEIEAVRWSFQILAKSGVSRDKVLVEGALNKLEYFYEVYDSRVPKIAALLKTLRPESISNSSTDTDTDTEGGVVRPQH